MEEKLESQFILRLPQQQAKTVKKYLTTKPKKIKKHLRLSLDPETREAEVKIKKTVIPMQLVDLPTITESLKTTNSKQFFKTADICQMLIPKTCEKNNNIEQTEEKGQKKPFYLWSHGLTPPLKNVRNRRLRRTLKNSQDMDSSEIEKELKYLLKMDNEAIAVRWELIDEDQNRICLNKSSSSESSFIIKEQDIFGDLSDEDLSDIQ